MSAPSIQDAVWKAADQLMSQGVRPTVANVRAITLRGSAGTINDALRDWWQDLAKRISNRNPAPDVPEPVLKLSRELWDLALAEGARAYQAYRDEAEQLVSAAEQARIAAENAQQELLVQLTETRGQVEQLQATEKELLARAASESALRSQMEQQLQEQREHSARAMADLDGNRSQLEKEIAGLAAKYQHAAQQARQAADALEKQSEQHRATEAQLRQQLEDSERQTLDAERLVLQLQTELRLLQQRLAEVQEENTVLQRDSQRLPNRRDTVRARLKRF